MSSSKEQGIYLITGATENVGRCVVKELTEHETVLSSVKQKINGSVSEASLPPFDH